MNLEELKTQRNRLEYEMKQIDRLLGAATQNEFQDYYGRVCTIFPSSLTKESCIWMGVKGTKGDNGTLMHLTIDNAKMIVKELNDFIKENE
jgi:hypothetical protein